MTDIDTDIGVATKAVDEHTRLLISELYQNPTVQGEGPFLGTPCTFMRLGGCNLQCGLGWQTDPTIWKCDSSYTWDWTGVNGIKYSPDKELKKISTLAVVNWLKAFHTTTKVRLLIVTGGEPLLQQKGLVSLFKELWTPPNTAWWTQWSVHMETNGTIEGKDVAPYVSWFSVSPKLSNSGNTHQKRYDKVALAWFAKNKAGFKFVVNTPGDFNEIDAIVKDIDINPSTVYIMPEGISTQAVDDHSRMIVDEVVKRGYNMTTRLHIALFGNTRGT